MATAHLGAAWSVVPAAADRLLSALAGPWGFSLHPVAWVVVLGVATLYAAAIRRPAYAVTRRQAWSFLGGVGVLLVAFTWPLAGLAAHHLLVALVLQRLLLTMAAAPLLLGGLPRALGAFLTRPPPVDAVAQACTRPVVAVVVVTVVGVATLVTPAVDAQASLAPVRGVLDAAVLGAGVVLWLPIVRVVPATPRMSPLGRAGYLIVQSIVPSFLAVVWIFARHPLYPAFAHHGTVLGMSPVLDQQLAGFVAKFGTIAALWTVAFAVVVRSERLGGDDADAEPLTWVDVERELERVARRERHRGRMPDGIAPPASGDGGEPLGGAGASSGDRTPADRSRSECPRRPDATGGGAGGGAGGGTGNGGPEGATGAGGGSGTVA